jgi:hypothetical protein
VAAPTVEVVGLKALAKDLARMSDPRAGALLAVMKEAGRQAAMPVADATRNALPHESGTLAGDVRVTTSRSGAAVRMGRKSVPYAGAVDFGGWPGGREYIPTGRYLFPAADRLSATAAHLYESAIKAGVDHFVWTNKSANPGEIHD